MSESKLEKIAQDWYDSLEDQTIKAIVQTLIKTETKRAREETLDRVIPKMGELFPWKPIEGSASIPAFTTYQLEKTLEALKNSLEKEENYD